MSLTAAIVGGSLALAGTAASIYAKKRADKRNEQRAREAQRHEEAMASMANAYNSPVAQMQRAIAAGVNPHSLYQDLNKPAVVAGTAEPYQEDGVNVDLSGVASAVQGYYDRKYQKSVDDRNFGLKQEEFGLAQQKQLWKESQDLIENGFKQSQISLGEARLEFDKDKESWAQDFRKRQQDFNEKTVEERIKIEKASVKFQEDLQKQYLAMDQQRHYLDQLEKKIEIGKKKSDFRVALWEETYKTLKAQNDANFERWKKDQLPEILIQATTELMISGVEADVAYELVKRLKDGVDNSESLDAFRNSGFYQWVEESGNIVSGFAGVAGDVVGVIGSFFGAKQKAKEANAPLPPPGRYGRSYYRR